MISISYNDYIKVETGDLTSVFYSNQLPLTVEFSKQINSRKIWSVELTNNSWASFPDVEMVDTVVKDKMGNLITSYKWDVILNGSFIYKKLWNYCLTNKNTKGLVLGTHNGEFGEWVPVATNRLSQITLVEASKKQFDELVNNYSDYENLEFVNEVVTKDGESTIFYEGGKGYTNTILKRVIDYWEKEPITQSYRTSLKFSDLVDKDISWIHTDVEGIDIELIMSLSDEQLNHIDIIIYEYNNSNPEERKLIQTFLNQKGYTNYVEEGVGLGFR